MWSATRATSSRWWLETRMPAPAPARRSSALAEQDDAGRVQGVGGFVEHDDGRGGAAARRRGRGVAGCLATASARGRRRSGRGRVRRCTSPHASASRRGARRAAGRRARGWCGVEFAVGERMVDQVPDPAPRSARPPCGCRAVEPTVAGVGAQHPEQQAHQGGLARAVEPDQRVDLAGGDVEVDVVDAGRRREHPRQSRAASPRRFSRSAGALPSWSPCHCVQCDLDGVGQQGVVARGPTRRARP